MQKAKIRKAVVASLAFALVAASGVAMAQAQHTPAEAAHFRHEQFKSMGGAFKAVNEQARASSPNVQIIRTNVAIVAQLAPTLPTWFPAGSGPGPGIETHAKAEVWSNAPAFADQVRQFQAAVQSLSTAAAGNDVAAMVTQTRAVGARCGSCHSDFRERS